MAWYHFYKNVPHHVFRSYLGDDVASKDLWHAFHGIMNARPVREVMIETTRSEKDKASAEKHRRFGYDMFKQGQYAEALGHYNDAARFSPTHSTLLGVIYANRSAVLFMMDDLKACLEDIDRALDYRLPEKITSLLLVRKERCQELLKGTLAHSSDGWGSWLMSMVRMSSTREKNIRSPPDPRADPDKLAELREVQKRSVHEENLRILEAIQSGERGERTQRLLSDDIRDDKTELIFTAPRNPQIPAASTALTMAYAPNKGRHYVANRDIEPGEFLVNERPYASALYAEHWLTHCQMCMRPSETPVPCDTCASVIFCSHDCKDKAGFHKFECPHMNDLAEFAARDQGILPLRMISSRDIGYFKSRENILRKIDADRGKASKTMPGRKVDPAEYLNVYTLLPHLESRWFSYVNEAALTAVFFAKCLMQSGYFGSAFKLDDAAFIARLLFHNLLAFECNYFTLSQSGVTEEHGYIDLPERGMAVFCGSSVFNHSCNPNAVHYFLEDNLFCRAHSFIPKGTEVNISYGEYFYVKERGRRQKHLKESYYFYPCGCEACTNDWPLMSELSLLSEKYKCPFCDQSFIAGSLEEVAEGRCPTCDRSMAPTVAEFVNLKQRADLALAEVHSGKLKRLSQHIQTICKYQKGIWRLHNMPNADYVNTANVLGELFAMESLLKRRGVDVDF